MIGDIIHIQGLPPGTVIRQDAEGHAWAWFRPSIGSGVLVQSDALGRFPAGYSRAEADACRRHSAGSPASAGQPSSP